MPSGRISKRDQETILEALERRRKELSAVLTEAKQERDCPGAVIWNLEGKHKAVVAAIHTIRDTMEVYGPCVVCGGTGYVPSADEVPVPVECPLCLGHAEQRTCPQCETPLRESAAGNWNCPWCGWSSIKVVTR